VQEAAPWRKPSPWAVTQLQEELQLQHPREAAGGIAGAVESVGSAQPARLDPAVKAEELIWADQATTSVERGRSSDHMGWSDERKRQLRTTVKPSLSTGKSELLASGHNPPTLVAQSVLLPGDTRLVMCEGQTRGPPE
jgi:hypothetical protein